MVMTDRYFLDAILEASAGNDRKAAMLAYADWLRERGKKSDAGLAYAWEWMARRKKWPFINAFRDDDPLFRAHFVARRSAAAYAIPVEIASTRALYGSNAKTEALALASLVRLLAGKLEWLRGAIGLRRPP